MKTGKLIFILLFSFLAFVLSSSAHAAQKTVSIPKGTKAQKIGPGHYRLLLPNQQVIELRQLVFRTGTAGYVKVVDPNPPHKPIEGRQVVLTLRKLKRDEALKLPPQDSIQIDDDIAWLPIVMTFQVTGIIDPEPPFSTLNPKTNATKRSVIDPEPPH